MGGHTVLVGQGKFRQHLFKKPTAAQARHAAKAKAPKPAPKHLAMPRPAPLVKRPPLSQGAINTLIKGIADFNTHLIAQHNLWYDDFDDFHGAVFDAHERFLLIMSRKPIPSLAGSIATGILTTLAFSLIPGLGPVMDVAKKLMVAEEAAKKLAEISCEAVKQTLEGFKTRVETDETGKRQTEAAEVSLDFFARLLRETSKLRNAVTIVHNDLCDTYLHGSDFPELAVRLPRAIHMWNDAGLEIKPRMVRRITQDQVALFILYDLMREYCKRCVTLQGYVDNPGGQVIFAGEGAVGAPDKVKRAISKEEFREERKKNPNYDVEFEGLNPEQRRELYKQFSGIRFFSRERPLIVNWLDLIEHWEFKED